MFRLSFLRITTALLGIVLLLTTACAKKEEVAPAPPTTGQLAGTLSPAGAATTVTATAADGHRYSAVPDAATGAFAFADLTPGTYQLNAVPTARFSQPDSQPVAVQAGSTTTANLSLVRNGRILGTFSWEQNGSLHTADLLSGTINSSTFFVYATETLGGGRSHNVKLSLSSLVPNGLYNFAGVGTYPLGVSEWTSGSYTYDVPTGSPDYYTTAYATSQVGQVVVTDFSLSARRVSGTFGFTATAALSGTGSGTASHTISNGRFDLTF